MERLGQWVGNETSRPECKGKKREDLQLQKVVLVSSKSLSKEGSNIRSDSREVRCAAQVGSVCRGQTVLDSVGNEAQAEDDLTWERAGLSGDTSDGEGDGSNGKTGGKAFGVGNFKWLGIRNQKSSNGRTTHECEEVSGQSDEFSVLASSKSNGRVGPGSGNGGSELNWREETRSAGSIDVS